MQKRLVCCHETTEEDRIVVEEAEVAEGEAMAVVDKEDEDAEATVAELGWIMNLISKQQE